MVDFDDLLHIFFYSVFFEVWLYFLRPVQMGDTFHEVSELSLSVSEGVVSDDTSDAGFLFLNLFGD